MPVIIGEFDVVNEVRLAPSSAMHDGSVVADGDLTVSVHYFYYDLGGVKGKYTGSVGNVVTDNAINYVYLDNVAALVINATGWPISSHIRLARVFAQGGVIVRISLERAFFTTGGVNPTGAIQASFSSGDAPGPVTIGKVPAGSTIEKTILEVQTPFDVGVQVSVGEATAMARLMAVTDNRLDVTESFRAENDYLCPSDMTVKVFFSGTAPTTGIGRVVVYYS
jgi:hypothetical protein